MSDFTSLIYQLNTGTNGTPTWTTVPAAGAGTGLELRFADVNTAGSTASASWPAVTRPSSPAGVDYLYVFTANTVSLGSLGGGTSVPAAFSNSNYMHSRWNWDNTGTFGSAPIFTAYPTTAHGSITRGDGSLLGGHASDTGATARSYLKGAMFGRVVSSGAPAAAPGTSPAVTSGTTGSVSPSAGANWSTWQGLQGDNDYLTFPSTPAATTADQLNTMVRLFVGPNLTAGTLTGVVSMKYTYV